MTDILDILTKEWPLFSGAPILAIGGALVIGAGAWTAAWKLKGSIDDGQVKAANERMQLAAEREKDVREKRDLLEREIAELKAQITGGAPQEALKLGTTKVARPEQFTAANTALVRLSTCRSTSTLTSFYPHRRPSSALQDWIKMTSDSKAGIM